LTAIGSASKFGVVIKSGAAFERLGTIQHLAVDKTGTLTRNQPSESEVIAADGTDTDDLLGYAAAVEQHSTHPLAAAITKAAVTVPVAQVVTEEAGHGISGIVDGRLVRAGSARWIDPGPLKAQVEKLEA